jgi:hypothetical protein
MGTSGFDYRTRGLPVGSSPASGDQRTMVSQAADGKLAMWDAITGVPTGVVQPGPASMGGVAGYGDDGHTIIVAYDDGSMVSFETDPDAWVAHACKVAGRNLTQDDGWKPSPIVPTSAPARSSHPTASSVPGARPRDSVRTHDGRTWPLR